ncbi:MAG: tetratricopeptide (TPR) repeat protein [Sulfurimonas sp.]|jgi:tetratricopeptide (TPR) repeat protein|uniref:DUF4365 domain-containing protein n=1 Tax=Sulfurimonas sp. TaxID=2022749 RepID=UPI0039E49E1A
MDMPKRPKEHQVEDLSVLALRQILPREWVYREKSHDYGIDGEIEIFDENGSATGMLFYVQLKATDTSNKKNQRRVQLANSVINYYTNLDVPVLIVRYVEETKILYNRWAHKIDRYGQKEGASSFSFMMEEDEVFRSETAFILENQLVKLRRLESVDNILPIKIFFNFTFSKICNMSSARLSSHLRIAVNPKSNLIQIVYNKDDSDAVISLTDDTLFVDILEKTGFYLHHINDTPYLNTEELIGDLFVSLSLALLPFNKEQNAITILESLALNSRAIKNKQIAVTFIHVYIYNGNPYKALELWENIPKDEKDGEDEIGFQILISSASQYNPDDGADAYEKYLINSINEYQLTDISAKEEKANLGICHYNYANFLRSDSQFKDSVDNFEKALKYNPHYNKEDYVFKEMAGSLFEMEEYSKSAQCYKNGLSLKNDSYTIALYADALMMSGEYKQAREQFQKYFEAHDDIKVEWCLKENILHYIIEEHGIEAQDRKPDEALKTDAIKNACNMDIPEDDTLAVLQLDALSPVLWYNLGQRYAKEEKFDDAAMSFLICALLNRKDTEAWINAFGCVWNTKKIPIEFLLHIIHVGYDLSGEEFINSVYTTLETISEHLPEGEGNILIMKIDKIIEAKHKINSKQETPLLRVFNGENFKGINKFSSED